MAVLRKLKLLCQLLGADQNKTAQERSGLQSRAGQIRIRIRPAIARVRNSRVTRCQSATLDSFDSKHYFNSPGVIMIIALYGGALLDTANIQEVLERHTALVVREFSTER